MLIHYNTHSDKKIWYGTRYIAVFHIGDCEPDMVLKVAKLIQEHIDSSIGTVFYHVWDHISEQGTVRLESAIRLDIETLREACNKIITLTHQTIQQ